MNLSFNLNLADKYKSKPQIVRILAENWVKIIPTVLDVEMNH